ncbi:ABC transporter substrate-binding protein [Microbacterium sp. 2MCAF23]|uniref:ABC transporter substrate-binding protein n=1 Tax=Microbacterium sp. 2MCAF23 TaxID=3232985 RepID=UPI003F9A7F5A
MQRCTRSLIAGAIVAGALLLAGCGGTSNGGGSAPTGAAAPGKPLVLLTPLNTLDPLLATTVQNDMPDDLLYDSIIDYNSKGEIVPRVATEWKAAADMKSVDLTLRKDITFTDGTKLTAKDVVYSIERSQAAGAGVAGLLSGVDKATATDDQHVTVTLKDADATFVGALSKVYVLNSTEVQKHAGADNAQAWLAAHAAGSGAYTLSDYTQGNIVKMTLNPKYWAPLNGRPSTFIMQNITEPAAVAAALKSGSANMSLLPHKDVQEIAKDSRFAAGTIPSGGLNYFFFNTQKGVTADPRVREAISLAFDYEAFLKNTYGGEGQVAAQIGSPLLGYDAGLAAPAIDLDRAKKLVDEAGASGAKLTMVYQPTRPDQQPAAILLQSGLKKIGIDLELQSTTFQNYLASLSSVDTTPDLAIASEYPRYPAAQALLNGMLNSKFVGTGSNKSQYANPQVDALLAQAQVAGDDKARDVLYVQIEKLAAKDFALRPVNTLMWEYSMSANVKGLEANPARILLNPMSLTTK